MSNQPKKSPSDEIEHLKGRMAALEHMAVLGLFGLGTEKAGLVAGHIQALDIDAYAKKGAWSPTFRAGFEKQIQGFITLCVKHFGNAIRLRPPIRPESD